MSRAADEAGRRVAVANARAAGLMVAALAEGGVRCAVVSPGSRNTPLVLALAAHQQIETWPVLDERVAGFFALGLARASGLPVVLACTSGSAAAHYLPAIIEADRSRVPLVVLTADRPPELHGCGAPQTLDQRRIFGAFTRLARDLPPPDGGTSARSLRSAAGDAVARSMRCPAGPVQLNLQFREPLWLPGVMAEMSPPHPAGVVHHHAPRVPTDETIERLAARVASARRGVIVCGPDAAPDDAVAHAIVDLAERLGWPVLAEAASGVRFDLDSAVIISTYDALLRGPFASTTRPDLVIRLGRTATSKPLTRWLAAHAIDRLITIDPAGERHDPDHLAETIVEADPGPWARHLASALPVSSAASRWLDRWTGAEKAARDALEPMLDDGWWSGAIAHTIADALPADGALHAANSMAVRDVDGFCLPGGTPLRVLVSRGANGIDGTIATAAGEALALAPRPLVALVGDLAALHDIGGLMHAGGIGAPLTVVVLDNGGGGIFEYLQIAEHPTAFDRFFITPQPARIEALCAGSGARYRAVDGLPALRDALSEAVGRPGVDVIHAKVERSADLACHRAAWDAVEAAVGGAP